MKKVLLFLFSITTLSTLVHAQISKGTVLLGGNVNVNGNKSESTSLPDIDKNKSNSFSIYPAIGVAIKPNTILGIQFGYSKSKQTIEPSSGKQEYENYRTELFLRKYLGLGKGFYLFAQPGVYFNRNSSKYNNFSGSESKLRGWDVGISLYPGVSYAVNNIFQLEASLGNMASLGYGKNKTENKYVSNNNTQISKSEGSSFSFSSSLSNGNPINIGFRFFIPKKKKA